MEASLPEPDWEAIFAPYDQPTYRLVLEQLRPDDIVLDLGAGDLRLDRQMARIVRKVYAVEVNARLLEHACAAPSPLPANLIPLCADARTLDFPVDITTGVLIMRHCTSFRLYADKLCTAGATRLITNARWRMGVEVVDLDMQRIPYVTAGMGWYACLCGGTGFKQGPVERWSVEMDPITNEVSTCPQCMHHPSQLIRVARQSGVARTGSITSIA
jgi:hypothetical protein